MLVTVWELYLNVLLECSTIMVKRIDGLDDEVKRQVFLRVNRLLDGLYKKEYEKQLKETYNYIVNEFNNL